MSKDFNIDVAEERVARAICASVGRDPDSPFKDKHGRLSENIKEWERWQGEAGAAIREFHNYLLSADVYWDECQECGVGRSLKAALAELDRK